jgi:glycerophosphoryl diester phosphodiesterase
MPDISWLAKQPIAHRGYHDLNKTRWENTLTAFEAAAERGFAIECDVHLSRDGVPVVIHDGDLKRLAGVEGNVVERTAAELAALRIGGTSDHIPTLREMLEKVAGRVPLVVELKGTEGKDEGLVAKVAGLLEGYRGKAAIMSFDPWLVREFPRQAPGIPGGLTAMGKSREDIENHFGMLAYGLSFASYNLDDMPNPFVTFMRERLSLPVISWTVRDRTAAELSVARADQMTFEGFDPSTFATV